MYKHRLYFGIIILLLILTFKKGSAQKNTQIEIVNANTLEFDKTISKDARRLIGNVVFKHENTFLYCDSAYFFSAQNKLNAYNNVKIHQGDSILLASDTLYYDGNNKTALMTGKKVTLSTKDVLLETNFIKYNIVPKIAYYKNGGKIINKKENSVLTSQQGYYFAASETFFFKDNVKLKSKDYTITTDTLKYMPETEMFVFLGYTKIQLKDYTIFCNKGKYNAQSKISFFYDTVKIISNEQIIEADSVYFNENLEIAEAFKNVQITDSIQKTRINSQYAFINQKDSSTLFTGNILLSQHIDEDTLFLHSDTLQTQVDSSGKQIMRAYHHVKFFKPDLQGKCDSLVFNNTDSTITLFYHPVIWSEEHQMTADTIIIYQAHNHIKFIDFINNAMIISENDTNQYNQLKGKKMRGFFKKGKLSKVEINHNAQSLYYAIDDSSLTGINKTISRHIVIKIDSNQLQTISFIEEPSAVFYPPDKIKKEERFLDGFYWYESIRPAKKEDIFIWE